ncbi:restriction endonuclease [Subdoligranulum sp. APC924/74]|uniref:restriction endonuclease n=1 Tax=Subdoligranulum sp. APC924/74 TaxID=2086273 RepID=UPI001FA85710|nr:restriction endonuclease [Subdoligranulum sp. APC924/74]
MKTQLWKTIKSRPYLITFCAVFVLIFLRFGISSIQRGKATAFVLLGIAIIAALLSFPLVRIENLIRIRVLEYKIKKLKKVLSDNYYPEMQNKLAAVDAMDGHEFEYFCAELLKENGFVNVEVTQASGDFGVDVLAEKDGVTYAVQCKCYSDKVGNHAVQEATSGAQYYHRMVAVVLTNSTFTPAAIETAQKTNVLLWDREKLKEMMA